MYVTADTKHIVVDWRADLANVIPHARDMTYGGRRMLLLPNEYQSAKVARNLGVPVPAPILTRYKWAGSRVPWRTQKITSALLTESARAFVLNEFGTGKTASVIWACDYLRGVHAIRRVLITAPLSTLTPVWEAELFKLVPLARVQVLHGTREERMRRLAIDADYYIINHHGLSLMRDALIKKGFDVFVIDELAVFRNKSTELWKAANSIIRETPKAIQHVWGLTGSPTPKAPTDAWAQVRLLTPDRTTTSLTRFRDMTMRQISGFKWLRRPQAQEIVYEAMQPSVRFALTDVAELPPTIYQNLSIELEPQTKHAYKTLFDKMAILTNKGETVTAVNEGVLQSKLMQVSLGYIYNDNKGTITLPNKSRLEAVGDLIDQTNRKVIVFVPFIHALEGVAAHLQKDHAIAVVHGQTPIGLRNKIFRSFQEDAEPRIIVAHPACMSHGLTLTAANTVIWFGPVNNYETYEQANARIIRPGQVSKTIVAHITATPVERLAYKRLQDRGNFLGMLLELFHQQELEF